MVVMLLMMAHDGCRLEHPHVLRKYHQRQLSFYANNFPFTQLIPDGNWAQAVRTFRIRN